MDLLSPAAPAGTTTIREESSLELAISALRAIADTPPESPWDHQVVVDCLRHVVQRIPLAGVASAIGIPLKDTKRLIQELAASFRSDEAPGTDEDGDPTKPVGSKWLFPVLPDLELAKTLTPYQQKKALARYKELLAEDVPVTWDDSAVDDEKAGAAANRIRRTLTDPSVNFGAVANRFLLRRGNPHTRIVCYPTLHATWRLAQAGLLTELALNEATTAATAGNVVDAYDALETFRDDAVQATHALREATADTEGVDLLAVRARPLLGGPVVRLERSLSIAPQAADPADFANRALREFAHEVSASRLPAEVSDLSDGHVLNAASTLGFPLDSPGTNQRREVAGKLEEIGAVDVDSSLIALWNLAYAGDREGDFWGCVEKYAEGDPLWAADLGR